jgi:hypothetical protein
MVINTDKENVERCKRVFEDILNMPLLGQERLIILRQLECVGTPFEMLYCGKPLSTYADEEIRKVVLFNLNFEMRTRIEKHVALSDEIQKLSIDKDVFLEDDGGKYFAMILFSMFIILIFTI